MKSGDVQKRGRAAIAAKPVPAPASSLGESRALALNGVGMSHTGHSLHFEMCDSPPRSRPLDCFAAMALSSVSVIATTRQAGAHQAGLRRETIVQGRWRRAVLVYMTD